MTSFQKLLLMLAVIGLGIGIPVSVSHTQLDPVWTFALPGGTISLGLFLITSMLKREVAAFKVEESSKMEAARMSELSSRERFARCFQLARLLSVSSAFHWARRENPRHRSGLFRSASHSAQPAESDS